MLERSRYPFILPRSAAISSQISTRRTRKPVPAVAFSAWVVLALVVALPGLCASAFAQEPVLTPTRIYDTAQSLDEDEMTVWVHPTDTSLSTVIVADKFAGLVFVYDLAGNLLQAVPSPSPRNIDVRYGVQFDGGCVDVIAFNERVEEVIRVYAVDPDTRLIERIDDGAIVTGSNYGFTLYRHRDGRLYGITGPRQGDHLFQFELFDDGLGRMTGVPTGWEFAKDDVIEGMAGDDETGYLYLGAELVGIWRVNAMDATDRTLIATVGDASGLATDVEGIAIYYSAGGEGYIIASSQGPDTFTVIERKPPHAPAGNFKLANVKNTDGIEVLNLGLGDEFPDGIFLAHDGSDCCSVAGARWGDIAAAMGLRIDTDHWDPRRTCTALPDAVRFVEAASGGSLESASVSTDTPLTPGDGDVYLAAVSSKPFAAAQSVAGLALDWRLIGAQCAGRDQTGVQVWAAQGSPSADGTVTATLAEIASSAALSVSRYAGAAAFDAISVPLLANSNGAHGACSDGQDGLGYSESFLPSTPGGLIYSAIARRSREHTPGPRYRERVEIEIGAGGSTTGLATNDRLVTRARETTVDGTFESDVDWAMVAFEVLPAVTITTTSTTTTTTLPPEVVPGDVNGDGRVTATDALIALGAAVGTTACQVCICDVDGSGAITATDALMILRIAVGMPVTPASPAC